MTRKLLNLAIVTALLVSVAAAALRAISYHRQGWAKWTWCGSSRCYTMLFGSYPGRLCFEIDWQAADARPTPAGLSGWVPLPMSADKGFHTVWGVTPPSTSTYDTYAMTLPTRPDLYQFAGFAWFADHASNGGGWNLLIPHRYFVLGGVLLLTYRLWLAYRARRRVRGNQCAACGYDLRATPDRCPECGMVPKS